MAIADDFTVAVNGDIRGGVSTVYSVSELHAWLQDLADDGSISVAGDNVSILTANPSKLDGPRSGIKPAVLNLLGSYNIDATTAEYFNFGSVQYAGTDDLYTGVKTIGSPLVAGSPMYITQNDAKLDSSYYPAGHIQVMIKAKTGGIVLGTGASGDIRVFSRKYGQTYGDFAVNLIAGGEQPAAISTADTSPWTPLNLAAALALTGVSVVVGSTTFDTGDGNGSQNYEGTITLSGGRTIAEAAQYCQAICDEASVITVDSVEGWRFRDLGNGANGYTPNGAAPFGAVAGGKWFVAQGWLIQGALAGDLQNYQMISDTGTIVGNPVVAGISIGGLTVGARVLVGRDSGAGFIDNEYTLNGQIESAGTTLTLTGAIKTDTPSTGYVRVNGIPYTYNDITGQVMTIDGTFGQQHLTGVNVWIPFLDKVAAAATEASSTYVYSSDFTARLKVRFGDAGVSLLPFETTFSAGDSATNGTNAIATADE